MAKNKKKNVIFVPDIVYKETMMGTCPFPSFRVSVGVFLSIRNHESKNAKHESRRTCWGFQGLTSSNPCANVLH